MLATLAIHAASGACLGARGSWTPLRRTRLVEKPCALPTYLPLWSSSWHAPSHSSSAQSRQVAKAA
eukprot:4964866-Pyramimonas_sp.AAC.1